MYLGQSVSSCGRFVPGVVLPSPPTCPLGPLAKRQDGQAVGLLLIAGSREEEALLSLTEKGDHS